MAKNELFTFLKSEGLLASSTEKTQKLLQDKSFQRTLRRVGEKASSEPVFQTCGTRGFKVMPSTHLNPMSGYYKCPSYGCRLEYADNFARRYALFSDQVVIPDVFSVKLSTADNLDLDLIKTNIDIIKHLAPLIEAKIVAFTPSGAKFCQDCFDKKAATFKAIVETIIDATDFQTTRVGTVIRITSNSLFSASNMGWGMQTELLTPAQQRLFPESGRFSKLKGKCLDVLKPHLVDLFLNEYRVSYLDALIATRETSLMLNGMNLSNLCSSHIQSNTNSLLPTHREADKMFSLPYLSQLSMEQIVRLRSDASESLSSLRCLLEEKVLISPSGNSDAELNSVVKDLRQEIVSVKRKLLTKNIKQNKRFDGALAVLGTSMVLYGVATQVPSVTLAAMAPLLASLNIMNTNKNSHEESECEIRTNPAYALLMAKDMLQCNEK